MLKKLINSQSSLKFYLLRFKKIYPEVYKKKIQLLKIFYVSVNSLHETSYSNRFWKILSEGYIHEIAALQNLVKYIDLSKSTKEKNFFSPNNSHKQFYHSIYNESILDNINHLNDVYENISLLIIKPNIEKIIRKKKSTKILLILFIINKFSLLLKKFFNFKLIGADTFNLRLFLILLKNKKALFFLPDEKIFRSNKFNPELRKKLFLLGKPFLSNVEDLKLWYLICFLIPTPLIENFCSKKIENKFDSFFISQVSMELEKKKKIAKEIENGVKLTMYNHGGNYFSFNTSYYDHHEVQISDIYFSWADTNFLKSENSFSLKSNESIHQIPTFNIIKQRKNKKYDFVLINNAFPKLRADGTGNPCFNQAYKQVDDVLKFLDNVVNKTENFLIKDINLPGHINANDYYDTRSLQKVTTTNLNLLISKSSLAVNSYYGTPFHSLMANDIPNIIFIKLSYYDFNKVFLSYLREFQKFQLVHFNPLSASKFIENNIDNIEDIWNDPNLIKLRKDFNLKFNQNPYNWQKKISNLI